VPPDDRRDFRAGRAGQCSIPGEEFIHLRRVLLKHLKAILAEVDVAKREERADLID